MKRYDDIQAYYDGLLDEYEGNGESMTQMAARLEIKYKTFDNGLNRARQRRRLRLAEEAASAINA